MDLREIQALIAELAREQTPVASKTIEVPTVTAVGDGFVEKLMKRTLRLIPALAWMVCAPGARAAELNVYAAASLTDALKELSVNYEKQTGDKLVFNLGASSTLARYRVGSVTLCEKRNTIFCLPNNCCRAQQTCQGA
jgi:hypothetical protein